MSQRLLANWLWPGTVLASAIFLIVGYQIGMWIPAIATLPALLLIGLYALERSMPAQPGSSSHEDSQRGNDLGHILFNAAPGEASGCEKSSDCTKRREGYLPPCGGQS
jgi:hypothetical protein